MEIKLTRSQIRQTVANADLRIGLAKYLLIQNQIAVPAPIATNAEFRKRFNGFYRVRRNETWQKVYYRLMDRARGKPLSFPVILRELRAGTGRCEASFASKLLATVNPDSPVIDSVVLGNVGERLPWPTASNRIARIELLYSNLVKCFQHYINSADGRFLIAEFRKTHAAHSITATKMLDLVLWQSR